MRYLSLLLLVFGLCSQPAMADNPMKTIFSDMMTNSTQPTTFSTAKRFGATGGGSVARVPKITPNVISVVPPKVNVGCGGVDFFTGSFSIISKDQMVQVMRGIANGAATYAFQVGMQAVCATCMSTLEYLSAELNKLNAYSRDACTASYEMIANNALGEQGLKHVSDNSFFKPMNVGKGIFNDDGDADASPLDQASTAKKADPDAIKDTEYNLVWDQLKNQTVKSWTVEGLSGYNWPELMHSLLGTIVVTVVDNNADQASFDIKPWPPTLLARDLLHSASQVQLLTCGNDQADCMTPAVQTVTNWKGLADSLAEQMLAIHKKIYAQTALDASEQNFTKVLDASFYQYLEKAPPGTADANIILYSKVLSNAVLSSSIRGFVARLKNWMGAKKSDQEAHLVAQLDKAMEGLVQQMAELNDETLLAQQQLVFNFQQQEQLIRVLGNSK